MAVSGYNADMLKLVPLAEIPTEVTDIPKDNLHMVYGICQEMESLCRKENGVGLAAVQVGIPWRLCVIQQADGEFRYIANGSYEPIGTTKINSIEGCLSIRNADGELPRFKVERWEQIKVSGSEVIYDPDWMLTELEKLRDENIGFPECVVWQHEIDHGCNVLISDIGTLVEEGQRT